MLSFYFIGNQSLRILSGDIFKSSSTGQNEKIGKMEKRKTYMFGKCGSIF